MSLEGSRKRKNFPKEEKQDLMHIAVCVLLSQLGFYEFTGRDEQGWPHFKPWDPVVIEGVRDQELVLKECIIRYFKE